MQFVTLKIYQDEELLHTHENVPAHKVVDLVINWNFNYILDNIKVEVINGSTTTEMTL